MALALAQRASAEAVACVVVVLLDWMSAVAVEVTLGARTWGPDAEVPGEG